MIGAKSKEEYYREAAQLLNTGEKVGAEAGEGVGGTLSFLTRGTKTGFVQGPHFQSSIRYPATRD